MPRRVLLVVALAALGAVFAAPALAANQAVSVVDNGFIEPRGAIKPGESVTWNATGTGNPHNVHFEDGLHTFPSLPQNGSWTTARTFPNAGTYRYYCQIHGGPGGQGMSGIVHVNAEANIPPVALLTVSPSSAEPGQTVSFSSGSIDFDGTISRHQWDLDGNGSFETDTGPTPTASRSYASTAALTVRLKVTDNQGASDERTQPLRINSAPSASFTVSPNPAHAGQRVTFDGSASSDSGGTIIRHEWDLDGNGSFETDTGATATASRSYAGAAAVTVKLRVTDDHGATGETTRPLQIRARPVSVIAPAVVKPPPPSFAASKKSLVVGKTGRFSYSFAARAGLTGTLSLRSVAKVRVSAKRQLSLGTRSFTVPASGVVKVSWKLSRKNLRILKQNRRIKFGATATLRNAAGGQSSAATTVTLKKPTR